MIAKVGLPMVAKTPKSKKARGRRLQNWTKTAILKHYLDLSPRDVRGAVMGDSGADIKLSEKAFKIFPFNVECKNQEKINVWAAYSQAEQHGDGEPLVIMKRNKHKPLAVLDAEEFIRLMSLLKNPIKGVFCED